MAFILITTIILLIMLLLLLLLLLLKKDNVQFLNKETVKISIFWVMLLEPRRNFTRFSWIFCLHLQCERIREVSTLNVKASWFVETLLSCYYYYQTALLSNHEESCVKIYTWLFHHWLHYIPWSYVICSETNFPHYATSSKYHRLHLCIV
jgi:hypothetical protein